MRNSRWSTVKANFAVDIDHQFSLQSGEIRSLEINLNSIRAKKAMLRVVVYILCETRAKLPAKSSQTILFLCFVSGQCTWFPISTKFPEILAFMFGRLKVQFIPTASLCLSFFSVLVISKILFRDEKLARYTRCRWWWRSRELSESELETSPLEKEQEVFFCFAAAYDHDERSNFGKLATSPPQDCCFK